MLRNLAISLLCAGALAAQTEQPAYRQVSSIPAIVDGYPVGGTFAFDAQSHRLYSSSRNGLYWLSTDDAQPAWHGPTFKAAIGAIRFAPELHRVFFTTLEDVGYVDVDVLDTPRVFAHVRASGLVYEPQRREIYLSHLRTAKVSVYDGKTGERSGVIEVPGWEATLKESIPGRVFLTVPDKQGLYVINANSHRLGPWPVEGKIVTPVAMEVDPAGRYVILAYDMNIVAIDTTTAKIVGRLTTIGTASIAYDPGANLLVVMGIPQTSPIRRKAYRVDAQGFTLASTLDEPRTGAGSAIEPTSRGFLQANGRVWLVWATTPR